MKTYTNLEVELREVPKLITKNALLSQKIAQGAHNKTTLGEIVITISHIRTTYWIPSQRKMIKTIAKEIALNVNDVEIYQTPAQNQGHCQKIELNSVIHLKL